MSVVAYTDGACRGNPGPGGWAWAIPDGAFASGASSDTTNQRMELQAALEAVRAIPGPLEVVSDSTYVVKCFQDKWYEGWLKRGWVNTAKKPVANRDLWEPLVSLVLERGDVSFRWVKGHAGNRWNDLADRLAVEASHTQASRSGEAPPETVADVAQLKAERSAAPGAIDETPPIETAGPGRKRADAKPAGRLLVVMGHQPPELGGFEDNPIAAGVRRDLQRIIEAKATMHEDLVVLSGLRLGAETLGAEAALAAGVPLHVVLPYPDPETNWPAQRQHRFRELVLRARDSQTLQRVAPLTKERAAAAMARRDAWFARTADEAILVWDGQDQRLKKLATSLEDNLGDEVWYLSPSR